MLFMKKRLLTYLTSALVLSLSAGCGPTASDVLKAEAVEASRKASEAAAVAAIADAATAEEQARKARADRSLLKKLTIKKDEMSGRTFYSSGPIHSYNNYIRLYIVESGDSLNLRLIVQYFGDDWLFVERAWTRVGGASVDLPLIGDWERDNSGGKVWEWSDSRIAGGALVIVKGLLQANNPTVRFEGSKYYKDFKPSAAQLQAMRKVLAAYEAATGTTSE